MLEGCMFSSLNSDLYFTDLYRPHNVKDRVRRPLTTMTLHLSENLMGDLFVFTPLRGRVRPHQGHKVS